MCVVELFADREVNILKNKWEAKMMIDVGKVQKPRQGLSGLHCRTLEVVLQIVMSGRRR